jgi:hypothetical protein
MPKGPRGEKRPADVIGAAIMVAKIATGEIECRTPRRCFRGFKIRASAVVNNPVHRGRLHSAGVSNSPTVTALSPMAREGVLNGMSPQD